MSKLAAVLAATALAVATYTALRPAPSQGVTSCGQLVHDQVVGLVEANGFRYVKESLWACHQDGDKSVARVRVWFDQIQWDPFSGSFHPVRQSAVLVFRFTRSPWQTASWHVASETP